MKITIQQAKIDEKRLTKRIVDQLDYFRPDQLGYKRNDQQGCKPVLRVCTKEGHVVLFETPKGVQKSAFYIPNGWERVGGPMSDIPLVII